MTSGYIYQQELGLNHFYEVQNHPVCLLNPCKHDITGIIVADWQRKA